MSFLTHPGHKRLHLRSSSLPIAGLSLIAMTWAAFLGRAVVQGEAPIALVPIFVVVGLTVAIRSPWVFAGVLLPLTASLWGLGFSIGPVGVSIERLIAFGAGVTLMLELAVRKRTLPPLPRKVFISTLVFFSLLTGILFINPTPAAREDWAGYMQKAVLAFIVFVYLDSVDRLKLFVRLHIASFVLTSVLSVWFIVLTGDVTVLRFNPLGLGRSLSSVSDVLWSIAQDVNLLLIPAYLVLAEALIAERKRTKRWLIVLAVFMLATSLLQFRRQVLFSIPICVSLFLLVSRHSWSRWWRVSFLVLVFLVIIGVVIPADYWHFRLIDETFATRGFENDVRFRILRVGMQLFRDRPWLGHGLGLSPQLIAQEGWLSYGWSAFDNPGGITPSNSFLALAIEAGVLGVASMVWFLAMVSLGILQQHKSVHDRYLSAILTVAPVILCQIFLYMLNGHAILDNKTWLYFGLLLAAARLAQTSIHEEQA